MRRQKVYMLLGLPGSGKSTWAKKKAKDKNTLIVSRDAIRVAMKYDYVFNFRYEDAVKNIASGMIKTLLICGFDVIIDETNITYNRREGLVSLIKSIKPEAKIFYLCFDAQGKNLKNRMKEPKGYTTKAWDKVIKNMDAKKEQVTIGEFSDYTCFVTYDAGKIFHSGFKNIRKFWL